jgi:hypothetical protein
MPFWNEPSEPTDTEADVEVCFTVIVFVPSATSEKPVEHPSLQ